MDDMSPAESATRHLQHRQFLVQSAKESIAAARAHREGKARSLAVTSPGVELPGAGSIGSAVHLDDARRKRVMLGAARPGRTLPVGVGMSQRQLERMPRSVLR